MRTNTKRTGRRGFFKTLLWLLFAFLFSAYAVLPAFGAEDVFLIPNGFDEVQQTLPDDVRDWIPEGMTSENTEEQGKALSEMLSLPYWISVAEESLREAMGKGVGQLAAICGLLVLASVFQTVRKSIASEALQNTVRFCTVGGLFALLLEMQYEQISGVIRFFDRLFALMAGMIPVTGTLLAMGGNVTTAAQGSATLGVFLSVAEGLCAKTVIPVCAIGTAMALCQALSPDFALRGVASALRKTYTFTLGFIMTLLCFLLSSQSTLCAAADSTGARAAKLLSGMAIPVVGSSVGDTLRTVAGSVQYLKSIVGIGGIAFVLLLLLPTLLSLLITRLVFLLGSGFSEILGCDVEGKLLSELGGVWGMLIAVVAMCSVMFIFALSIFVRIAVAAG